MTAKDGTSDRLDPRSGSSFNDASGEPELVELTGGHGPVADPHSSRLDARKLALIVSELVESTTLSDIVLLCGECS
jgi:hypothetical protein